MFWEDQYKKTLLFFKNFLAVLCCQLIPISTSGQRNLPDVLEVLRLNHEANRDIIKRCCIFLKGFLNLRNKISWYSLEIK